MRDNLFFWITITFSSVIIVGLITLALHSSPSLYQQILRLCGVSSATCQRIIEEVNPATFVSIAALVWIVAVFLWQLSRTQIFLLRKTRQSYPLPNTLQAIGLRRGLYGRLLVVPGDSLFCAGIVRPRIFIGRNLLRTLSRDELEAALVHESYHLHQRDPLKILLVNTFSISLFFLPAIREVAQSYLREKEISADRLAEAAVGKRPLSRALIKAFRRGADRTLVPGFTAGLTSVRNSTTFSSWGWGLTVLLLGLGWIVLKSSFSHGSCS